MEKRIRVLVVDDDTALRQAWAAIFAQACGRVGVLCIQDLGNGRLGRLSEDNPNWRNLAGWDWSNQADWFYNNNPERQVSVYSEPYRNGTHFTISYGQAADSKYKNFGQSNYWRG